MPKKSYGRMFKNHTDGDLYTKDDAERHFMEYLRENKLLEGKKVIVNEEIEQIFGSALEELIDTGRDDDVEEDGGKTKVRTEESQVFKKAQKKELLELFN